MYKQLYEDYAFIKSLYIELSMGNETSTQKKRVPVAKMVAYTVHHHIPPSSPPPAAPDVDLNRSLDSRD